jgi:hypothetical protein
MRPEANPPPTLATKDEFVPLGTIAKELLKVTMLFCTTVSKFVPVIVTGEL